MPDSREEQDGQSDEDNEAGQGFRGGDLGPDQGEAEPSTLGVADLLFDGHPAIIESGQLRPPPLRELDDGLSAAQTLSLYLLRLY